MTEYEEERNKLIPEAERRAELACRGMIFRSDEWNATWNRVFHAEMDRLWRERK